MPAYRYELQQESGELLVGQLVAQSASGAASALKNRGGRIVRLVPLNTIETGFWRKVWSVLNAGNGPSKKDILDFTTQLAVMVRAGISLRMSIGGICEHVENDKFKVVLE